MKLMKAMLWRTAAAALTSVAAYLALLCIPQPLFSFSVRTDRLTLHSDRPFSVPAAESVLRLAEAKLDKSPLYLNAQAYEVFICNSPWRQRLFFNMSYGAGGVALYPVTTNLFLSGAVIEDDRLISPLGMTVMGDRTLDYFIAHEVTHELTDHAIGPVRYFKLPQWVREGYADYVGKGKSFDYNEARHAFLAGVPEMDWSKSGLYWRFHLLVAQLLEHQHWSVAQMLAHPPSQEAVEAAVREEQP